MGEKVGKVSFAFVKNRLDHFGVALFFDEFGVCDLIGEEFIEVGIGKLGELVGAYDIFIVERQALDDMIAVGRSR